MTLPILQLMFKTSQPGYFFITELFGKRLPDCKAKLNTAFQTIAAKVLLRLTQ